MPCAALLFGSPGPSYFPDRRAQASLHASYMLDRDGAQGYAAEIWLRRDGAERWAGAIQGRNFSGTIVADFEGDGQLRTSRYERAFSARMPGAVDGIFKIRLARSKSEPYQTHSPSPSPITSP